MSLLYTQNQAFVEGQTYVLFNELEAKASLQWRVSALLHGPLLTWSMSLLGIAGLGIFSLSLAIIIGVIFAIAQGSQNLSTVSGIGLILAMSFLAYQSGVFLRIMLLPLYIKILLTKADDPVDYIYQKVLKRKVLYLAQVHNVIQSNSGETTISYSYKAKFGIAYHGSYVMSSKVRVPESFLVLHTEFVSIPL